MTSSVFTPVDMSLYQVINGRMLVLQSPIICNEIILSKKTLKIDEKKKRKRWTNDLKEKAVELGKEVGLSKATRILQKQPEYKELCSSTLYYWLKSNSNKQTEIMTMV